MASTKKTKKQTIKPSEHVQKLWKEYTEQLEDTGVKLPEMEALRPYMGKRGRVLKKSIRSKESRAKYRAAEKKVQAAFPGRSGSAAIGRAMKSLEVKTTKRLEKAAKTYAQGKAAAQEQREAQRQPRSAAQETPRPEPREERAPETAKPEPKQPEPDKPLTMREKAEKALKEAEAAAMAAQLAVQEAQQQLDFAKLLEQFQKGSREKLSNKVIYEVYRALEYQGIEPEDIDAYLDKLNETMNDIPDEARALWEEDEFAQVLIQVHEFNEMEREDFSAMLNAVLTTDKEGTEDMLDMIRYWQDQENNPNNMSFSQFWEELQDYNNMLDQSAWEEILGGGDNE